MKWLINHVIKGWVEALSFRVTGGTSSQFLKADGSLDNNDYAEKTDLPTNLSELNNDVGYVSDQDNKVKVLKIPASQLSSNTPEGVSNYINGLTGSERPVVGEREILIIEVE